MGIKSRLSPGLATGNPTGEDIPNGAQTATQSDMGADLGESKAQVMPAKWRHVIRRPAELTGTRHELCTWHMGGAHQTWCLVLVA
jgi:hypothetical protein